MENQTKIITIIDRQEYFTIQQTAKFFGGYCYRVFHKYLVLYYAVLSREPLSNEQVIDAVLKNDFWLSRSDVEM